MRPPHNPIPDRRPQTLTEPKPPLGPTLTAAQSDAFERAHARVQRCMEELRDLDQQPGGGDPQRKLALQEELRQHTDTIAQLTRILTVKLNVALEEELATMNRAQRRVYEATMRKKRKAKAKAKGEP